MGCSPIGIGSDGGGSVRIPANYCGLYGVRPTGKRFTLHGHRPPSSYTPRHIFGCAGPLAKSVRDCERVLETLQNRILLSKGDPLLPALPWNSETVQEWSQKKLRIGVIRRYDILDSFKGQKRAIDDTVQKMKARGHQVVEFDLNQDLCKRLIIYFLRYTFITKNSFHEPQRQNKRSQRRENYP